jgi:hypothetical protein
MAAAQARLVELQQRLAQVRASNQRIQLGFEIAGNVLQVMAGMALVV